MLRWLLGQPDAAEVVRALAEAKAVFVSPLTLAETGRALARLVALQQLTIEQRQVGRALLAEAAAQWSVRALTEEVVARVGEPFPVEPVRTLDAIHLATASLLATELGPIDVLSVDDRIRRNARALGLRVLPDRSDP